MRTGSKKHLRKLWQGLDRAIYEGRSRQFLWLGALLAFFFAVMLGLAYLVSFDPQAVPDKEALFVGQNKKPSTAMRVLELILDPGSFVGSHEYGHWFFQLLVVLVGATFFTSFLIGAIGNLLNRRVEALTKGQYTYEFEDHVLILGSSSILENLLQQICGRGCDIVIMTENDVESVRESIMAYMDAKAMRNIYVIFGKRTNPASLDKVHVSRANAIYILGEDEEAQHDGMNLKCWHYIVEKCARSQDVKNCYLVLDRLTTHNVFSYRQESCSTDNLRLNVVSAVENMAQGVLVSGEVKDIQYPCLDRGGINEDSDISVHLVVVGMTQIAYAMATTAAHICHFPNFMTKNKRTKITFIQKDIKREVDFWMGHFNALMDLSYAEYVSWDDSGKKIVDEMKPKPKYISANYSDPKGFLDIEWEFIDAGVEDMNVRDYIRECVAKDGVSEYLSFAFCGHNAEDNVAASLYLPEEVYEKSEIPVFVYQPLTRWVLSTARQATRYSNLYPFGMRTDCFDPQQERLRWAMKIKYLYDHWEDYKSMGTEEELASGWYKKGEQYIKQQSNIYAANSVPVKFRSIGMDLKQRTNLTSHEVEILAEIEHNRWNVERLLNGDSGFRMMLGWN